MTKKLYRVSNGKMIAGVCNGIAEYFEIDPTIVRLLWLTAFFCAGAGFWAYVIAAIIIPSKVVY